MSLRRWSVTLLAALVALVTIAPLIWMVSVSFMSTGEAANFPPPLLPKNWTLDHYRLLALTLLLGWKLGQRALPQGLAQHWRTLVMGCWRWLAPLLIGGILLRGLI